MAAALLACLSELALHSNHDRSWRGWLDRSVDVAATYAKYVVAVDQQRPVHGICDTRHFLGLSNEGIAMVRACIRADSALDTVLGWLRRGYGTYWRLALRQMFQRQCECDEPCEPHTHILTVFGESPTLTGRNE